MSSGIDVSVIVPTYNERENVTRLIKFLHEIMVKEKISYEIVVVDDNSPDGTAEAVKSLSHMYNVKLIVRPGKLGLASAVLEGLKVAKGSIIAVMDADLQHPPEALPEMLKKVSSGCDVVIGSRYVKGGSIAEWSLFRRVVSRGADLIAKILLPKTRGIKDTMSGYFVLKREVIDGVSLNPRGFKILLEVITKGRFKKVCEYPIEFRARTWGESKLGVGEVFNYILHVLDLAHEAVRFVIVGTMGTLVNLATLFFLGYLLSLEHWITVLVAFETSTLFNFTLHELWTFKTGFSKGVGNRLAEFHGAVALHFISQVVISNLLFYGYGVERVLSQLSGILVGFSLNYILSKHVVWRRRR
ncbi:MAG: glycosyltransferase family 2 protein [Sulfolobales archaeon]